MIQGISYFDIGILVVLLIFVVVGLRKGFVKSVLGLIGLIASVVVAIQFAAPFAEVIKGPVGGPVNTAIGSAVTSALNPEGDENSPFAISLSEEEVEGLVALALQDMNLPEALTEMIAPKLSEAIIDVLPETGGASVIEALTDYFGTLALMLISGAILFIGARIVFAIVEAVIRAILGVSGTLRQVDRLLGAVVGAVKAVIAVALVFTVLTFVLSGVAPDENSEDLKVKIRTNIEQSSISKLVWDVNPVPAFLAESIDFSGLFQGEEE